MTSHVAIVVPAYNARAHLSEVLGTGDRLDERLDKRLDEKVGKKRATIIRLMKANPGITVSEVAKTIQISRTGADKNIQILKRAGYIKRIGPAKGGHWEVLK